MASVFDYANFFIDYSIKEEDFMTNLRVNKLLYFAQGYHLVRTGNSLFTDTIEPWTYGPVVSTVYQKYKSYGRNPINVVDSCYSEKNFTEEEWITLVDICHDYCIYTTPYLVELSHVEGSPWEIAHSNGLLYIDLNIMKTYFSEQYQPDSFESMLKSNVIDLTGYRNQNGILVLPHEDDDDDDWSEYDEM